MIRDLNGRPEGQNAQDGPLPLALCMLCIMQDTRLSEANSALVDIG